MRNIDSSIVIAGRNANANHHLWRHKGFATPIFPKLENRKPESERGEARTARIE